MNFSQKPMFFAEKFYKNDLMELTGLFSAGDCKHEEAGPNPNLKFQIHAFLKTSRPRPLIKHATNQNLCLYFVLSIDRNKYV